ncbi:hypothetical protein [Methylobacterium pseudosasicola]|uniref:Uncharacterized protein n=1 Tax=Methylobacterium pseudosasicola TaxID=582667 RepID=A0A1I4SL32_9HYPH|nr:hypothetical protein [Methylobacterium pseudosasicola]SFM65132.1 hypothetical protein SAMN05192568_104316 [Methylobacterium pseudosasicola]
MTDTNVPRAIDVEASIARWRLTLARFADNDNDSLGMRAGAMVAMMRLPLAATAALAACLRFLP